MPICNDLRVICRGQMQREQKQIALVSIVEASIIVLRCILKHVVFFDKDVLVDFV